MKVEGKTVAVWLPKGVLDRLPELRQRLKVNSTSMAFRFLAEYALSLPLGIELAIVAPPPKGAPLGERIQLDASPKGEINYARRSKEHSTGTD